MMAKDRLHVVALVITSMATMFQYIGVLLPNWWELRQHGNILTAFSLFGHIRCSDTLCYPEDLSIVPVPEGKNPPQGLVGENAAWLQTGRVFLVLTSVSILATLIVQLVFLTLYSARTLQILANSLLIFTALLDFIAGFLFVGVFKTLSQTYSDSRPLGALNYTSAPVGLILFASVLCVGAAVFTTLTFTRPARGKRVETGNVASRGNTVTFQ